MQPREIPSEIALPTGKIAIIASRFNDHIVDKLLAGAQRTLLHCGLTPNSLEIYRVPGAFELPLACQKAAQSGKFSGIIALGAIIRGGTPHFDFVAKACTDGILQAQLTTQVPMTFGVLTTDTVEQALARADGDEGNKGCEAAIALLEVIQVLGGLHA